MQTSASNAGENMVAQPRWTLETRHILAENRKWWREHLHRRELAGEVSDIIIWHECDGWWVQYYQQVKR